MVPFFKIILSLAGLLLAIACLALPGPVRSGFHLPDSISELTVKYKSERNLIILPVSINDSVQVNLILDTGSSNLILFGKSFEKYFHFLPDKQVRFSGMGSGNPVLGKLSINNCVKINSVMGLDIPVVVVREKNVFGDLWNVQGIVGYEVFQKFEIEINPERMEISFRSPIHQRYNPGFIRVPFTIRTTRPILNCEIFLSAYQKRLCELMIDTGSEFGLLVKSRDEQWIAELGDSDTFAQGFNGEIEGVEIKTSRVVLPNISFDTGPTRIIQSPWHDYASIGMGVLKEYVIIINYVQGYVELKKRESL